MPEDLKITDEDQKVYIVLAAPRSGSTFMSRALMDQGIDMGISGNQHNEDREFLRINKKLLSNSGGSFKNIPAHIKPNPWLREEIAEAFAKRKDKEFWGFKDPRTCLTIQEYLPHLVGKDAYLICIFRKPEKVQHSMKVRKGHDLSIETVREYSRRTIQAIKDFVGL